MYYTNNKEQLIKLLMSDMSGYRLRLKAIRKKSISNLVNFALIG